MIVKCQNCANYGCGYHNQPCLGCVHNPYECDDNQTDEYVEEDEG